MLNFPRPDPDRGWSVANVTVVTWWLFLAGFYFVPNAVDLYYFFIATVFFPSLLLIPSVLKLSWNSLLWRCLLVYLGYMLLSSLWSENFSGAQLWRDTCYTLYILSFILVTLYFFQRNPGIPEVALHLVALVAIGAAAISIALFEPLTQLPALPKERLAGVGIIDNMNPSAFIYGFFGLVAVDYVRHHWGEKLAYVYAAGFAVLVLFVILTQSNAGLLALISACGILFLLGGKRRLLNTALGLFTGLVAALYLAWSLGFMTTAMDLGFSLRFPIWEHVLAQWQGAPVFGNGFQKTLVLDEEGSKSAVNYAHSLFLATLRDGGLVGSFLLISVYALALWQGFRMALAGKGAFYLSLLSFGLICVIADVDQVITRPRELWIILWLPLSFLIAYEVGLAGDKSPGAPARPTG